MLKFLMVTSFYPPYHVGGACTHVYYLANELAKQGHEVHIVFSMDAYRLKRNGKPKKNYVNHENVILHRIDTPLGRLTPLTTYMTGKIPFKAKLQKIFEQDFDIIHYHNVSLFGPDIFKMGKGLKLYTAHDHWLVCAYNDMYNGTEVCKVPRMCPLCLARNIRPPQLWRGKEIDLSMINKIIAPSRYIQRFLKKHCSVDSVLIPNFVPGPPEVTGTQGDYFLYAGMLEDIKGIRELVQVFRETGKNLVIAGDGSLKGFVESVQDENIKYVGFLGKKELYSYYKHAKAFVLASNCPENSPLTLLEAMSVGTPAVGKRIGGIPEIIEKVDKSLCFENMEELKLILHDFKKPDIDIRAVWKQNYSKDTYIKKYLKLISGQ